MFPFLDCGAHKQKVFEKWHVSRQGPARVSTKRGIRDHGDFCRFLLEATVENALKMGKLDLFMDTPFEDTPFGPARVSVLKPYAKPYAKQRLRQGKNHQKGKDLLSLGEEFAGH